MVSELEVSAKMKSPGAKCKCGSTVSTSIVFAVPAPVAPLEGEVEEIVGAVVSGAEEVEKLAVKLDLDGAYIPAFNKNFNHLAYSYKKNFKIIGSAHNHIEIRKKIEQGCKIIFLSPLFK